MLEKDYCTLRTVRTPRPLPCAYIKSTITKKLDGRNVFRRLHNFFYALRVVVCNSVMYYISYLYIYIYSYKRNVQLLYFYDPFERSMVYKIKFKSEIYMYEFL